MYYADIQWIYRVFTTYCIFSNILKYNLTLGPLVLELVCCGISLGVSVLRQTTGQIWSPAEFGKIT